MVITSPEQVVYCPASISTKHSGQQYTGMSVNNDRGSISSISFFLCVKGRANLYFNRAS